MYGRGEELAEQILQSDRLYFEMAATVGVMNGAELAWMPELQRLPGGCVVQRVDLSRVDVDCALWLRGVEASLRNVGAVLARFLMKEENGRLEREMLRSGYTRRMEIGYLLDAGDLREEPSSGGVFRVREARTDEDWRARRLMVERAGGRPDGYASPSSEWVLLERRKCRTGGMTMFLIEEDGRVVAGAGVIRTGKLVRCRNLVLPNGRAAAIAPAVLRSIARAGAPGGVPLPLGDLVVAGSREERFCREATMRPVTRLFEWTKPLH